MLNLHAYRKHVGRWRGTRWSLPWWRRFKVRSALARRYRSIGLAPPVHAFVDSPISAIVATGIAVGVRWLQRHPETHVALFGHALDEAALRRAIRDAITEIIEPLEYRPDAHGIESAIVRVTSSPPALLPALLRAPAREIEALASAHRLAAVDGVSDPQLLVAPLAQLHERVYERLPAADRITLPTVSDPVAHAIDETLQHGLAGTRQFLARVFSAWWSTQQPLARRLETIAFTSFFRRRRAFGLDYAAARDIELAHTAQAVFTHADFWIAADWPTIYMDEAPRLHRLDGPAIAWRDGSGISLLHGVRVTRAICEGRFTIGDILHAYNAEVRRTMIELYERGDRGRFLREADADVMHIDYDRLGHPQRLLRFALPGDEAYVGVEVTNSTPEPDGTHKRYILRVPPTTRTCRAAIAWTFGLREAEYEPEAET